MMEKQNRAR